MGTHIRDAHALVLAAGGAQMSHIDDLRKGIHRVLGGRRERWAPQPITNATNIYVHDAEYAARMESWAAQHGYQAPRWRDGKDGEIHTISGRDQLRRRLSGTRLAA